MVQGIRQWYYRGSLDSCNYSCNYCPFSKKPGCSREELAEDEKSLIKFVDFVLQKAETEKKNCAVQIVPYGEALIHKYYWRELARLTCSPYIEAAGAQTNLSFDIHCMAGEFQRNNGEFAKLRLWCTFHPQMVTMDRFLQQCRQLSSYGILYCAGTVGVPAQAGVIKRLREKLPEDVYLWINKMDGLKRRYTEEETRIFSCIDEYFETGLKHYKADTTKCTDSLFAEADGSLRRCNTCIPGKDGTACTRKECSCYLSYCNQKVPELVFFNPYSAFRIPHYPKAAFFDVDGTLLGSRDRVVTENTTKWLKRLAAHSRIFLATSLPYRDALRKTAPVADIISGGVFAHGGICVTNKGTGTLHKKIYPLKYKETDALKENAGRYGYNVHIYNGRPEGSAEKEIYKITLSPRTINKIPAATQDKKARSVAEKLGLLDKDADVNVIIEDGCIQLTSTMAGKREGILHICNIMGYKPEDIAVFGNSASDVPMLKEFGFSVAVNAGREARQAANYCIRSGLLHA